jgi:hypothetical protein
MPTLVTMVEGLWLVLDSGDEGKLLGDRGLEPKMSGMLAVLQYDGSMY